MDNRIRQQNRNVCELFDDSKALRERIAELERYRTAYMEWSDKTDWMQGDKRFDIVRPLGKHRADSTHGRNSYYLEVLYCRQNCGYLRENHD